MTKPKPPRIRIVGTGETATVTVNDREWSGYMLYIPDNLKAQKAPTIGTHMTETYGVLPDFDMLLIPTEQTEWSNKPSRRVKVPKKRGRKPKNDIGQRTTN